MEEGKWKKKRERKRKGKIEEERERGGERKMEKRKGGYGKGKRRGNKKKSERGKGKRKRSGAWGKGDFSELPKHRPAGPGMSCSAQGCVSHSPAPVPPASIPATLWMPPAPRDAPGTPSPTGSLSGRIAAGPWQPVSLPSPSQPPGIAQA